MTRIVVYVDYQNTYMRARSAFGDPSDPFTVGQVHPRRLGVLLRGKGESVDRERELIEVRVYRGEPDSKHDRLGQAACQRQLRYWSEQAIVTAVSRPLQYQARVLVSWSANRLESSRKWHRCCACHRHGDGCKRGSLRRRCSYVGRHRPGARHRSGTYARQAGRGRVVATGPGIWVPSDPPRPLVPLA